MFIADYSFSYVILSQPQRRRICCALVGKLVTFRKVGRGISPSQKPTQKLTTNR